jgi:hypothetical protein
MSFIAKNIPNLKFNEIYTNINFSYAQFIYHFFPFAANLKSLHPTKFSFYNQYHHHHLHIIISNLITVNLKLTIKY